MNTIANSAGAISPTFNPFVLVDKRFNPFIPQIGLLGLGVYHALANYADNVTRICWPRQSTIANFLGISLRSVNRGISKLVEAGLIEIVQERPGYSHVYRLLDVSGFRSGAESNAGAYVEDAAGVGGLADAAGEGTTEGRTLPGEGTTEGRTIELDLPTSNYTQEQQQSPALEQTAQPEPVAAVVVYSDEQESLEPSQESTEKPLEASEVSTLSESLPLPKSTAEKLLERAPATERRAIVETFNAARASRSILKPAAYLAALVQAAIVGTFTPEAAQQAQQEQESRRRKSEALERSIAANEARALERLGLASGSSAEAGRAAAGPGAGEAAGKVSALRASLRAALRGSRSD